MVSGVGPYVCTYAGFMQVVSNSNPGCLSLSYVPFIFEPPTLKTGKVYTLRHVKIRIMSYQGIGPFFSALHRNVYMMVNHFFEKYVVLILVFSAINLF